MLHTCQSVQRLQRFTHLRVPRKRIVPHFLRAQGPTHRVPGFPEIAMFSGCAVLTAVVNSQIVTPAPAVRDPPFLWSFRFVIECGERCCLWSWWWSWCKRMETIPWLFVSFFINPDISMDALYFQIVFYQCPIFCYWGLCQVFVLTESENGFVATAL